MKMEHQAVTASRCAFCKLMKTLLDAKGTTTKMNITVMMKATMPLDQKFNDYEALREWAMVMFQEVNQWKTGASPRNI